MSNAGVKQLPLVQKARKLACEVAAMAFIAAMLLLFGAESLFVEYSDVPEPELHRTVPHLVKGVAKYITSGEQFLGRGLN